MNIRVTLLALALFSLLVTGIGGGIFYHHLSNLAVTVGQSGAERTAVSLSRNLGHFFSHFASTAKALSVAPEYVRATTSSKDDSLNQANKLLDRHCAALSGAICYLMAPDGTAVASSNRHTKTSFVGGNYGFRPYFQAALAGNSSTYLAEGVTSKKRGVYFSAPVFSGSQEVVGVFVIKAPIQDLDALISGTPGIIALTNPKGVVFASNRPDWLYRSLQPLSDSEISNIVETRQFCK